MPIPPLTNEIQVHDYANATAISDTSDTFLDSGTINGGSVYSWAVTAGGTGYTSDFDVTATGGAGSGAKGRAVVSGGAVVAIIPIVPGSGYTSDPTPDLSAGAGSGATATASRLIKMQAVQFDIGEARFMILGFPPEGSTVPGDTRIPTPRRRNPSFSGR